jgi:hypothetical protein
MTKAKDARNTRAMQIVSVRFGEQQLAFIQAEAEHEGVSASQFIRDASYARAIMQAAERKTDTPKMWLALVAVAEELGPEALVRALHDAQPTPRLRRETDPVVE